MTLHGSDNMQYTTSRELGRGGEGVVYELQGSTDMVLKHYTEPLTPQRVQKLHKMVLMRSPAIDAYAAWPQALVRDAGGSVCGFIMRKLSGFMPLHMIFSPLDRKRMFPDKGYNFLVHVARNLAVAFHKLHQAGLVVGDVNEGNILIDAQGMVAFIDCDSFQVKGDDGYFYCEVGVPRYTPPELLELQTFEQVVRITNTDVFSMAVLIFQLLFLGRHPFAGRNRSAADIDEETAIKLREFAYSTSGRKKKLSPPKDSFDIAALTPALSNYFHQAFETNERPAAADWARELDNFLLQMVTCGESRIHVYPSGLQGCPWCAFRKERGIMYFLDDSYFNANSRFGDIDQFVNGFRVEQLYLKPWDESYAVPAAVPEPVSRAQYIQIGLHWALAVVLFVGTLLLVANIHLLAGFIVAPVVTWLWHYKISPTRKSAKEAVMNAMGEVVRLSDRYNQLVEPYNNPPDLQAYKAGVDRLAQLVLSFRKLPEELYKLQQQKEKELYDEQWHMYLRQFDVQSHTIPSFGAAKKNLLLSAGIRNAADISLLLTQKVTGIGPKNIRVLLGWQLQMANGFNYIPEQDRLQRGFTQVSVDIENMKVKLEHQIRVEYQALNHHKVNIINKRPLIESQIKDILTAKAEAEAYLQSLNAYRKYI